MNNKSDTLILKHKVDKKIVYRSLSMLFISLVIILVGSIALYYSVRSDEVVNIQNSIFESISAFATVGISAGVTAQVGVFGRIVLMLIMFVGRVGPISLLLSISIKHTDDHHKVYPEGKIMVT